MQKEVLIKVENLVKEFKTGGQTLVALKGLSFTVNRGEFIAVTGRSGSGKSTLLYQLGILDHPTSGSIFVDDRDITKLTGEIRTNFRLRRLGYVFQDYALIPVLTTEENVILPLLMQGIDNKTAIAMGHDALEKVGLKDKYKNLPSQLSGGQQQRVSIARAIAHKPEIIFADEPTANLDSDSSEMVLKTFLDLHKADQTIVMVTHEHDYAKLTERIIELSDGTIIKDNITN